MKTRFCNNVEKIENYESAKKGNFKGWVIHHKLETHTSEGERRLVHLSVEELKALDMYYNRPAEELIYLKKGEHTKLHHRGASRKPTFSESRKGKNNPMYGKLHSEETKRKLSELNKGNLNPNYGKSISEEQKIKISNSMKGHKGNGQTLTQVRKAKKWSKSNPLYTPEFFASLDPNISYTDFKKVVSKSFCIWKKFQKYLKKN